MRRAPQGDGGHSSYGEFTASWTSPARMKPPSRRGFLEGEPDLEDLGCVEVKFRVQAMLDSGGLAKAVLLARKQQVTNWFVLAAQHFDQGLRLIRWHDGVLGSLKEDNWFR